jgi:hypothetical protein
LLCPAATLRLERVTKKPIVLDPNVLELRQTLEDARDIFEHIYRPGLSDDECEALADAFQLNCAATIAKYEINLAALFRRWRDALAEIDA